MKRSFSVVFGFGGVSAAGLANAALDSAVSTALGTVATDVGTLGGLVLLVAIAIFGIRALRRTT